MILRYLEDEEGFRGVVERTSDTLRSGNVKAGRRVEQMDNARGNLVWKRV